MKRFYKQAEAGTAPGGYVIRLDGKTLKTPLQKNMILPNQPLAAMLAAEWNAQKDEIIPASMPRTQLVHTLIDKGEDRDTRALMTQEVLKYGSSDLLCYMADHPHDLVQRQQESWGALLAWAAQELGQPFESVQGIRYINQPAQTLDALRLKIETMTALEFTLLQALTALTGSVIIALAFVRARIDAQTAWQAACIDEIYQLEKWGEDTLARQRLDKIRAEIEAAADVLAAFNTSV